MKKSNPAPTITEGTEASEGDVEHAARSNGLQIPTANQSGAVGHPLPIILQYLQYLQ